MAANRVDQILDQWEPKLQQAFLDAIYQIRSQARFDAIVKMLENGDIDGAIYAVGLDPSDFRPVEKSFTNAFEAAAIAIALTIPFMRHASGATQTFKFDLNAPAVAQFTRAHLSETFRRIIDDQRDMLRAFFAWALQRGVNPRTAASDALGRMNIKTTRREGGYIGLTSSQAQWTRDYADEVSSIEASRLKQAIERKARDPRFDIAVKRSIDSGEPIPADEQRKMVTAYRNHLLGMRAGGVALFEVGVAVHEGQRQALSQAIGKGAVSANDIEQTWYSQQDNRVRRTDLASHVFLHGKKAPWGGHFVGISGAILRYPRDPEAPTYETMGCRCYLVRSVRR